jgi:hypothetical protein
MGGAVTAGWDAGWSAGLGVAIVFVNVAVSGYFITRAARISLQALYPAALGGFLVRMAAIVGLLFLLNRFEFFSPLAFALAVVPATILMLAYEIRLVARGLGSELQIPPPFPAREGPTP